MFFLGVRQHTRAGNTERRHVEAAKQAFGNRNWITLQAKAPDVEALSRKLALLSPQQKTRRHVAGVAEDRGYANGFRGIQLRRVDALVLRLVAVSAEYHRVAVRQNGWRRMAGVTQGLERC
jgi:hypothetical protein